MDVMTKRRPVAAESAVSRPSPVHTDPRYDLVFCLYHMDGKSQSAIGRRLGISRSMVAKILYQLRNRKRSDLFAYYVQSISRP
jgi:DNA-binding MarR family transcriptional regulator